MKKLKTPETQRAAWRRWAAANPEKNQARKDAWAKSPAGKEWLAKNQKKKNRRRMQGVREAKRAAAMPPPLPSVSAVAITTTAGHTGPSVAGNPSPLCAPVAGVVVPWSVRLLEKPAKLLTRILDRLRCGQIFKKLDGTKLPDEVKSEIKKDVPWKDAARDDFAICLAECVQIELNKRQVSAKEGHWINLGLSAGELALAHFDLCQRIEKLAAAEAKPSARDGTRTEPGKEKNTADTESVALKAQTANADSENPVPVFNPFYIHR